jgi:histidinol dehydrogenase
MAVTLRQSDADFEQRFAAFLLTKREVSEDVDAAVRQIIARVRTEGDAALIDYSRKFDRADLGAIGIAVSRDDIARAYDAADPKTIEALEFARDRIRSHHERQRPKDDRYTDAAGVELGWRWTAIEAVGLYVPGGTASYPSSVLMNAVPARSPGSSGSSWWCRPRAASSIRWCWPPPTSLAYRKSTGSAARRRLQRSRTAPPPSSRSPRSSAPAMPMWRRPSARCSAPSAST